MLGVESPRVERVKEARLSLIETLRVQRVPQVEQRVVEVMAELVEERAEKSAEGDHLPALGGEHPHGHEVAATAVGRRVEALELAAAQRRPARGDAHADTRNAERGADVVADALGERLHVALPTRREHRGKRCDRPLERRARAQRKPGHAIARRRDSLERRGKAPVPRWPWPRRTDGRVCEHVRRELSASAASRPNLCYSAAMPEAPVTRLAAAIEILVRAHKTAAPAPRGLAYLGLEGASGTGFHLLDARAARGIFRKDEFVLDVGAGLGGTSRWLAGRLGCEVVGTAASRAEAEAGASLTRRAGLAAQEIGRASCRERVC